MGIYSTTYLISPIKQFQYEEQEQQSSGASPPTIDTSWL